MGTEEVTSRPQTETAQLPTEFELIVVNLDKVLFEGKSKSVIAPGPWGNFAILPGHTPLFIKLDKGKLVIHNDKGSPQEIDIENGIAKINQTKVVILVGF